MQKWHKFVANLRPNYYAKVWRISHLKWQICFGSCPHYFLAKWPLSSYLTSLSLSNLISKIKLKMLTLLTSQGLWGLMIPANFCNWTLRGCPCCLLETSPEITVSIARRFINPWYNQKCLQGSLSRKVVFCSWLMKKKLISCIFGCIAETNSDSIQFGLKDVLVLRKCSSLPPYLDEKEKRKKT